MIRADWRGGLSVCRFVWSGVGGSPSLGLPSGHSGEEGARRAQHSFDLSLTGQVRLPAGRIRIDCACQSASSHWPPATVQRITGSAPLREEEVHVAAASFLPRWLHEVRGQEVGHSSREHESRRCGLRQQTASSILILYGMPFSSALSGGPCCQWWHAASEHCQCQQIQPPKSQS